MASFILLGRFAAARRFLCELVCGFIQKMNGTIQIK